MKGSLVWTKSIPCIQKNWKSFKSIGNLLALIQNNCWFFFYFRHNIFLNVLVTIIIYSLTVLSILLPISPFLAYYLLNKPLELPMPLLLIEINYHTTTGYLVTYIYQLLGITLCVSGFMLIQSLNVMFSGLVPCMIELLRFNVRKFEQMLLMDIQKSSKRMKEAFAALIEDHNEIFEVAGNVEEILSCIPHDKVFF